ncbi:MAG: NAD(P)(+) transhydrogenase (Re/Si-specific) subunit beta [Actinomycetota bacterium]|jgi:NAD(P) transhydrogenase subunit beta|nr:NAD(P)(+) transhydrogenase (Re/Si-specific) subunit beta [Actinomycetota bacterium]MED5232535.1 NAD(P)(+) transhydrogenase (Re/Si-specific) subunit beta [Actinomycetota bacterium]MED5394637.1 NAD(P)(+) transhydrogenase (Re/Si-specific) subunit beta [Actinomycetota bacterium]MEE3352939.1 NAD(P)(+) transhydrogenase (Re/Si-specific) subunit beta [Actinomycetota bacterium]
MSRLDVVAAAYLVAAILFVLGLKSLARPRTAPRGNLLGASGMLVAVVATLLDRAIVDYSVLLGGLVIGSAVGVVLALRVRMTAMPQLVALFNGFGGGASVLVALASFVELVDLGLVDDRSAASAALTALIGAVTLAGSFVAVVKLLEVGGLRGFPGLASVRAVVAVVAIVAAVMVVASPGEVGWLWTLVAAGAVLGVLGTVAIGGADMPVVIALLNSCSGLAASTAGFVLDNPLLIIAGSLVGASGLILTQIMCRSMNRSLVDVVFGSISSGGAPDADDVYGDHVTATSAEEVAMLLEVAERVVIVPGYGLAVAQAQHAVRDLMRTLGKQGTEVVFGIHPVAGRMPGHMNVLLAEAEIDYELLLDMDQVNPTFPQTDVTIVIGANDVVNPSARTDPDSPIAGMPILDVDGSRTVVVIKRSLSPGFAGIPNPLFAQDGTLLLFGDGKDAVLDVVAALLAG